MRSNFRFVFMKLPYVYLYWYHMYNISKQSVNNNLTVILKQYLVFKIGHKKLVFFVHRSLYNFIQEITRKYLFQTHDVSRVSKERHNFRNANSIPTLIFRGIVRQNDLHCPTLTLFLQKVSFCALLQK